MATIRELHVHPVTFGGYGDARRITMYAVGALMRDCLDSMYEPIAHDAVFRTALEAEAMLERIRAHGTDGIDWEHWIVGEHTPARYCPLSESLAEEGERIAERRFHARRAYRAEARRAFNRGDDGFDAPPHLLLDPYRDSINAHYGRYL